MRIALVSPYSVSVPGGVQNQVLGLAGAMRKLGHEVTVVAPVDGPAPIGVASVGRSVSISTNGSKAPVAPYPAAALRALRILRGGAYDIVHLHEPFAPSITIPVLAFHRGPMVGTFHAAGDQTAYRLLGRSFRPLARRLAIRAAVSVTAASPARRYLGGSYEVLFNGIDARRFQTPHATRADPPAVLFLGREEPRKGLRVMLQALDSLPPPVTLWVAGPGTADGRVRHRYGNHPRISWLGELSEAEKIARLRAASAVCVPSLEAESFGIVLLEAMAAGTPVVASDLPAYRAVTDDGSAALLSAVADPVALAGDLLCALRDKDLATRLQTAGHAIAARYDLRALAERYLEIYGRVEFGRQGVGSGST
jgi:phosphatidylinositol alpha-mannosyltransferase